MIVAALLLAVAAPAAGAAAETPGFWSCQAGAWEAVGAPEHAAPEWDCGATGDGSGAADTEEKCLAQGGYWGPIGLFPEPLCVLPTADGGRACQDSGECTAGACLADFKAGEYDRAWAGESFAVAGQCATHAPLVGCLAMVDRGVVNGILCID
jgi:hypothetical protein